MALKQKYSDDLKQNIKIAMQRVTAMSAGSDLESSAKEHADALLSAPTSPHGLNTTTPLASGVALEQRVPASAYQEQMLLHHLLQQPVWPITHQVVSLWVRLQVCRTTQG